MTRKPGRVLHGQLSDKARQTLHKPSRVLALNLRRTKLSKKVLPDPAKSWSATRIKDELTDLVSFNICGPTKGGDTFEASIPAEQREELKRVRRTLGSYDAALPGQVDDALKFLEKLFAGANVTPLIATKPLRWAPISVARSYGGTGTGSHPAPRAAGRLRNLPTA